MNKIDMIKEALGNMSRFAQKITTRTVYLKDQINEKFTLSVKVDKNRLWLSNGYNRVGYMIDKRDGKIIESSGFAQ